MGILTWANLLVAFIAGAVGVEGMSRPFAECDDPYFDCNFFGFDTSPPTTSLANVAAALGFALLAEVTLVTILWSGRRWGLALTASVVSSAMALVVALVAFGNAADVEPRFLSSGDETLLGWAALAVSGGWLVVTLGVFGPRWRSEGQAILPLEADRFWGVTAAVALFGAVVLPAVWLVFWMGRLGGPGWNPLPWAAVLLAVAALARRAQTRCG